MFLLKFAQNEGPQWAGAFQMGKSLCCPKMVPNMRAGFEAHLMINREMTSLCRETTQLLLVGWCVHETPLDQEGLPLMAPLKMVMHQTWLHTPIIYVWTRYPSWYVDARLVRVLYREDPITPDFSVNSVDEWLDAMKMGQYKDNFTSAGYVTLDSIIYISVRYRKPIIP